MMIKKIVAFSALFTASMPGIAVAAGDISFGDSTTQISGNGGAQVTVGDNTSTYGDAAITVGNYSTAAGLNYMLGGTPDPDADNGKNAIAIGSATNPGTGIGGQTYALGDGAVSIGSSAAAVGNRATALGMNAMATVDGTLDGDSRATAIGSYAAATGTNAVGVGFYSSAVGNNAVAVGSGNSYWINSEWQSVYTTASGANATAIGSEAMAIGANATALGFRANATGATATAIGTTASAVDGATATGYGATASGLNSTATGSGATASAAGAIAIGAGASAAQAGAMAIGTGATTSRANQVAVGTSSSTYTLAGVGSSESLAAQSGPIKFVTSDGQGNLGTSTFNPDELQSRITDLSGRVTGLQNEIRKGIALASASAQAPMPSAPGRTSWAANTAHYKGETAFSGAIAHRLDFSKPFALTAGVSVGVSSGRSAPVVSRIGLQGEF